MENQEIKSTKDIMEEVSLKNVEVLEETFTPDPAGFSCSYHGWFGFGC
ncbi:MULTISPECIES: hypothetical protein [unclassified Clostridium]|jgi:hypothetical protein